MLSPWAAVQVPGGLGDWRQFMETRAQDWGWGETCRRLEGKARLSHHSVTPTFVQTHSSCPVSIPMNAVTTGFVCNFGNSYTKLQFKKFQLFFKCWFKIVALEEEGGKKLQKYSNIIHRT